MTIEELYNFYKMMDIETEEKRNQYNYNDYIFMNSKDLYFLINSTSSSSERNENTNAQLE